MTSITRGAVLVVDKPRGPTSHDVVSWARRALGTRSIGHAGTLDPMATGVLVLGVDEGTKLLGYLGADDKVYQATIALGAETLSLDADGEVTERADVPVLGRAAVEAAAAGFVGTYLQRAPAVSAIKKDGVALHARVRRGDVVEAPEREVRCDAIDVLAVEPTAITVRIACGKGFYVRSLGRDLARALGTRGHLSSLRRVRSGAFDLSAAVDGDRVRAAARDLDARAGVRAACVSLEDAVAGLAALRVDETQARDLGHGKALRLGAAEGVPLAVFAPDGLLVAIARASDGVVRVARGFPRPLAHAVEEAP